MDLVGCWGEGPTSGVAVQGNYAYLADGGWLEILDISSPANPIVVGRLCMSYRPQDLVVSGVYAYVAAGPDGVRIVDVSDPAHPTEVGFFDTGSWARDVRVMEPYVYVADYREGLRILDVSDPTAPIEVGYLVLPGESWGLDVSGSYAYVANYDGGLRIVDVSDPAHPFEVTSVPTQWLSWDVEVVDSLAFLADGRAGLRAIDVSDPTNPKSLWTRDVQPSSAQGVAVTEGYILVANFQTFSILPRRSYWPFINVAVPGFALDVAASGNVAYVVGGGLHVVEISDQPTILASYDPTWYFLDVRVSGSYAYMTGLDGIRIFDVSDPANLVALGVLRRRNARRIVVSGNHAYVVDGHFRIYDVSDPTQPPSLLGTYDRFLVSWAAVSGDFAYLACFNEGLRILDVSDPANPVEVGFYDPPAPTVQYLDVAGNYVYMSADGVRIVDVRDPMRPVEVAHLANLHPSIMVASGGYLFYLGGRDLWALDVTDPTNPVTLGSFNTGYPISSLAVSGGLAYVGTFNGGLRVIDVHDPKNMTFHGFYDFGGGYAVHGVASDGRYVYTADQGVGFHVFEVRRQVPVLLRDFMVSMEEGGVRLQWVVEEEGDIQRYLARREATGLDRASVKLLSVEATGRGRYEIDDDGVVPGMTYRYTLIATTGDDKETLLGAREITVVAPQTVSLRQNVPNPFNPTTEIEVHLPVASDVELSVYDLLGRRVATIVRKAETAGVKRYSWSGTDDQGRPLPSGVYMYRLRFGNRTLSKKMVLAK